MKDRFHLILGIIALIGSIFLAYAFTLKGFDFNMPLVYIGSICFFAGIVLFFINDISCKA